MDGVARRMEQHFAEHVGFGEALRPDLQGLALRRGVPAQPEQHGEE
jgi:hypothetical protein